MGIGAAVGKVHEGRVGEAISKLTRRKEGRGVLWAS